MNKPRVFVGSSVEGLNVAYAVQQNLSHSAEVTVWDQGVFKLSHTTIDSLNTATRDNDFAIFVFSPDDLALIRNDVENIVRDNVLFELGLFIGKLGRERVFFIMPNKGDLHIPTDLVGITPGKYDSNRSDGSLQAATGPVCHQIRTQIKNLGLLPGRITTEPSNDGEGDGKRDKNSWISDILEEKFDSAKATLLETLPAESGDEVLTTKAWVNYCNFKLEKNPSIQMLTDFAVEHHDSITAQCDAAFILRFEKHVGEAIRLLRSAKLKWPSDVNIANSLAQCYVQDADNLTAIQLLRDTPGDSPEVAVYLADILEREGMLNEALETIRRCHIKNPHHENLRFKYARVAQELNLDSIATYMLNGLAHQFPHNIDYSGYLGNSCVALDLPDCALVAYRKAENLSKMDSSSQWITANIGNLFKNKGFPSEACIYLERAIKYESHSDYSHDRLSGALKAKAAEKKEFEKKCADGLREIRQAEKDLITEDTKKISNNE